MQCFLTNAVISGIIGAIVAIVLIAFIVGKAYMDDADQ